MINLYKESMRKLVKATSGFFLNKKCPIWLQRKGLNILGGYSFLPKPITTEKETLGNRPVWWFNHGKNKSKHVILYFHGGGYSIGSPKSHRDLCAYLAKYAEISVASLAYRLAPEHPFPAAVDDAINAFKALNEMGFDSQNIVLAGDSAGGGLALSLALKLKHHQIPQPASLFLISPLVNFSRESVSHTTQHDVDPVINRGWAEQMASNYLSGSEDLMKKACMLDKDITGLAPILVHVGTDEVLLDDSLALKQKAVKVGVQVKMVTYPELWHVFHFSPSLFKPARAALNHAGQFIRQTVKLKQR